MGAGSSFPIDLILFGMIAAFLVLRFIDAYGEPNHWEVHERGAATFVDFLNNTKYPPSLMFLLMTLGPAAIFCACADRMHGFFKDAFANAVSASGLELLGWRLVARRRR